MNYIYNKKNIFNNKNVLLMCVIKYKKLNRIIHYNIIFCKYVKENVKKMVLIIKKFILNICNFI